MTDNEALHEALTAALHNAIWDMAHTDQWPICGDDWPAAKTLADALIPVVGRWHAAPCVRTPDGWCSTHSTASGPAECGAVR